MSKYHSTTKAEAKEAEVVDVCVREGEKKKEV